MPHLDRARGAVVIGVMVVGAGIGAWRALGARAGTLGRLVAGFGVLCGLALVVVGA